MDTIAALQQKIVSLHRLATNFKTSSDDSELRADAYLAIVVSLLENFDNLNQSEQDQVMDLFQRIDGTSSSPRAPSVHADNELQAPTASNTHENDDMQTLIKTFDKIFINVKARQEMERSTLQHVHASPQNETEYAAAVGNDDNTGGKIGQW